MPAQASDVAEILAAFDLLIAETPVNFVYTAAIADLSGLSPARVNMVLGQYPTRFEHSDHDGMSQHGAWSRVVRQQPARRRRHRGCPWGSGV